MTNTDFSRRDFLRTSSLLLTGLTLSACTVVAPASTGSDEGGAAQVAVKFAWWGSPFEKDTVVNMLDAFTEASWDSHGKTSSAIR